MSPLPFDAPSPPAWHTDFEALDRSFAWVRALRGCPQDPVHHAEGDVWIHTRMVCEALSTLAAYRALAPAERWAVFAAALLHDVAKPACTRADLDGSIHARGHSARGAAYARVLLWRLGVPFASREEVVGAIRYHQVPFFLVSRDDSQRRAFAVSYATRCDHLALVTEADARGRFCADQGALLDAIELFREYCAEQRCLDAPRPFPSASARFRYFQYGGDPDYCPHEDVRPEATLMSGLPGSGKDHWVRAHAGDRTVISLDDLRREYGVDPADRQGSIVAAARERARVLLRAGQSFVWNATNLSRDLRAQCVRLFTDYGARVRIVYVEASAERQRRQNRERPAPVPESVIERMLARWEVPDATEAHEVEYVVADE